MKKKYLQGTIKRHPDGFGFFIPEQTDHPDVYIPRHSMNGVMTNDKVMIEVQPERGGDRFRGEIIKILKRGTAQIVGRFSKVNDRYGILKDEGKGWGEDLRIRIEDSKNAKDGDLVAADILKYPDGDGEFTGKVKEVIGNALDPMNDIRRVVFSNSIPQEFSAATLAEAKKYGPNPTEDDFKGRKDLRDKSLITIDGATAKDFDDAVLVEVGEKGFKLFVAIADVSHYVRLNSAMDKDAYERGTSVYFPNFVIPMLPEQISNGLCSLNPHVPRLCVVAEMNFDFTGEMQSSQFYEAVMESKARVTYGEAQEVIDGFVPEKFAHVKETILRCADLAKILMAKRFSEGSLDLEIPETQLEIDGSGMPIDIQKSERLFSHRLIEELMLAANVAVAKFLGGKNIPSLYRIHEPPNEVALRLLERYLASFGGHTKLADGKLQKRLTKALQEFSGKPQAQVLNILTLRSMSQAKYSVENLGHFGLGFDFYTHFTSPIRRYPDLIIHRLIKSQILKGSHYRSMPEDDLMTAATWLSACEQKSVKAERQIQAIKKARFMEAHVGKEFDGIISSVAKFGVFVLLREFDIDGLIRSENLAKDKLEFDEEKLLLYAKRSGQKFRIGDHLRIKVESADVELGQINFTLLEVKQTLVTDEDAFETSDASDDLGGVIDIDPRQLSSLERKSLKNKKYERTSNKKDKSSKGRNKKSSDRRADKKSDKDSRKSSDKHFSKKPQRQDGFEKRSKKHGDKDRLRSQDDGFPAKDSRKSKSSSGRHQKDRAPSENIENKDKKSSRFDDLMKNSSPDAGGKKKSFYQRFMEMDFGDGDNSKKNPKSDRGGSSRSSSQTPRGMDRLKSGNKKRDR